MNWKIANTRRVKFSDIPYNTWVKVPPDDRVALKINSYYPSFDGVVTDSGKLRFVDGNTMCTLARPIEVRDNTILFADVLEGEE